MPEARIRGVGALSALPWESITVSPQAAAPFPTKRRPPITSTNRTPPSIHASLPRRLGAPAVPSGTPTTEARCTRDQHQARRSVDTERLSAGQQAVELAYRWQDIRGGPCRHPRQHEATPHATLVTPHLLVSLTPICVACVPSLDLSSMCH